MANRPYKEYFVATTGTLLSSGTTTDLGVGQLGIFNVKNWQATTAPLFPQVQSLVIAQGTPELKLAEGELQSDASFKTSQIFGKNVKSWRVKRAQKPQQRIVAVGFNGNDGNLTAAPGEVKTIYLTLTGQPISRFYSDDQKGLTVALTASVGCVDDCTDSCGDTVNQELLADAFIKNFYEQRIYGNQKLSDYIKIEKVLKCETPSGYATTEYTKWQLTICDDGSLKALGIVQAQYPGLVVKKHSRNGSLSTYEIVKEGGTTPDAFNTEAITVVPNCAECPSGYTLQDQTWTWSVVRADAGSAGNLNTIKTDYSDTTATRLSYQYGVSVYIINKTTDATVSAVGTDVVTFIGTEQNVCVQDAAVEVDWTEIETCEKAQKTYSITLGKPKCDEDCASLLATLQDYYTNVGTVSLASSDSTFCSCTFNIVVESDNVFCPDCDYEQFQFTAPSDFNGQPWTEVTANNLGTNCDAGLKFTSSFYMPERDACTFEGVPYYSDPLYIAVSTFAPEQQDNCAAETGWTDITILQEIKFPSGYGAKISEWEKLDKYYRSVFYNADPVVRKYRGYEWNTDFQGWYDEYVLDYSVEINGTFGNQVRSEQFETHFYIPQTEGNAFETAINTFLSSLNINVPLQVL